MPTATINVTVELVTEICYQCSMAFAMPAQIVGEDSESISHVPGIDWVIAGGESGPGARPCDIAWLRSIVQQCQAAGVSVFVKQLGAKPIEVERWSCEGDGVPETSMRFDLHLKSRMGSDPEEWPSELRVRQFPEVRNA